MSYTFKKIKEQVEKEQTFIVFYPHRSLRQWNIYFLEGMGIPIILKPHIDLSLL